MLCWTPGPAVRCIRAVVRRIVPWSLFCMLLTCRLWAVSRAACLILIRAHKCARTVAACCICAVVRRMYLRSLFSTSLACRPWAIARTTRSILLWAHQCVCSVACCDHWYLGIATVCCLGPIGPARATLVLSCDVWCHGVYFA